MEEGTTAPAPVAGKSSAGKIVLIIVIVLVVLIGGLAAYGKLAKGLGILSIIENPRVLAMNSDCSLKDKDLCRFLNNWKEEKYWTMTSENTDKSGTKSKLTYKSIRNENSQMIVETGGKETSNMITIGNDYYTKDYSDNKWFKFTTDTSGQKSAIDDEATATDFDSALANDTSYKKMGKEACGKLTCFKYEIIETGQTEYREFIYFDTKQYELRKTRTEMNDGSVDEATFDYSRFTIGVPSPIKEASNNSLTGSADASAAAAALGLSAEDQAALEQAAQEAAAAAAAATGSATDESAE